MPNPFSSDYAQSPGTQPITQAPAAPERAITAATEEALPSPQPTELRDYGFEPERYGSGKPRRVIIRGKIAIE
jgi:hypothetical protein